ncbi:Mhf2p [Lachancea thermotolerans CBS 6340]|uniref:KLTH0H01452p n=1 Tax=Lachancea thermotolerans (strain ATCC 56472 / CBS 6340 / NRRL Y-8284) TaxID=559295 RepID=C5E218_LACTC|nr:KLTH0H01452p [Lachancea thermotolerans CBS 6340]CAR30079.1 KLTH0H01452p [Lachancea thermotolerans CBS 6340]
MPNSIPSDTIARIFQTCSFKDDSTRITESTLSLVDAYLEVFVREALLRSIENKEQVKSEHQDQLGDQVVLTHKDLERVSGLLLLDM